ncbi:hypothetical protein WKI65_15505 [Streptomyces sp. MS1.AVA.3]|uniref:hypothetical protein n=1 Tax=Streptomyces decoyicus TaxID=249567 RepID=UPI0030BF7B67
MGRGQRRRLHHRQHLKRVTASTKGHNSPYNACKSKNVAEGKTLYLQACFKKSGFSYCSPRYKVWA